MNKGNIISKPLIQGDVTDLIKELQKWKNKFPRTIEVFLKILEAHQQKHPLLEDWLIIVPYRFLWVKDKDYKKHVRFLNLFEWFEAIFKELADPYPDEWKKWVEEVVEQTNATTIHAVFNRIYDYLLQVYAAVWRIRKGYKNIYFPPSKSEGGSVDVTAEYDDELDAVECKFIKTSEKFLSYLLRLNIVYSECLQPFIVCDKNFTCSSAAKVRELRPEHCHALRNFLQEIFEDPENSHKMVFATKEQKKEIEHTFTYNRDLPMAITIESQANFAKECALDFLCGPLLKIIDDAVKKQLNDPKYSGHKKILFIGLQADFLYGIDWTSPAIEKIKDMAFVITLCRYNVRLVFSDQVGFSVDGYL